MINALFQQTPVSPPSSSGETPDQDCSDEPMLCAPCVNEGMLVGGWVNGVDEEEVDTDLALLDDPIVGVERVLDDHHGPGAIEAKPLSSPTSMTPAAFMKHCLTHLPYHPGCPICAANRRPNTQHRQSHEHARVIPLLVGDYGFIRSYLDEKVHV